MNWSKQLVALLAFFCMVGTALAQIEVGQMLRIRITGVPAQEKAKIDEDYPVSEKGEVNLPYIGRTKAVGLQPDELAKEVENVYRRTNIYANPKIRVIVTKGREGDLPPLVQMRGQVRMVGPRMFENGLTVSQAIEAAGGPTQFAATHRVFLWRGGNPQKIDLNTPAGKAVAVKPHDTIEVPYQYPAAEDGSEQDEREGVAQPVVYLSGQVRSSGQQRFENTLTVFQAVQASGASIETGAAMDRVILWRGGEQHEIDLSKQESLEIITMPYDTIHVPKQKAPGR